MRYTYFYIKDTEGNVIPAWITDKNETSNDKVFEVFSDLLDLLKDNKSFNSNFVIAIDSNCTDPRCTPISFKGVSWGGNPSSAHEILSRKY